MTTESGPWLSPRAMPDDLAAWLAFLGISGCPCRYTWKGLGVLYGQSMGKGWVRMTTDPVCPRHGQPPHWKAAA